MKKHYYLLTVLFLLATTSLRAQLSGGLALNYTKYLGGSTIKTPGVGVQLWYDLTDESALRFTFLYNTSATESESLTANAYSSSTTPSSVDVTLTTKTKVMMFNLDARKFFGDGDNEDGGFYGLIGIGLAIASPTYEFSSYNSSLYSIGFGTGLPESTSQLYIRGFLGYEKSLDRMKFFGEAGLGIPANKQGDQIVEVNLPAYFNFNIGLRIPFGN
jgi:hypothetical protein